ncbi:MAG: cyanophycin synthetase [bacterium]
MNAPHQDAHTPPSPLAVEIVKITYLKGPNMWTYTEALEAWVDLGILEEWPSNRLPGFVDRLLEVLPSLGAHFCSPGVPGGFLLRLREGTWMGHILEHIVIELLEAAGLEAGFGQTRETIRSGLYRMVFRVPNEKIGRVALKAGHDLLHAVLNNQPFDVKPVVSEIRYYIDVRYLGPSTAHIVKCATKRKIPHIRLNQGNLVQLGYGARQIRIWTAETDLTSAIAEGIAAAKNLTKSLLKSCGVPVPNGELADSPHEAWIAAEEMGLPVVVKPTDGNRGRGVMVNLSQRADIEKAWKLAKDEGSDVIVENYIEGDEHRVLVVGGHVVAACRGEAAWVVGDGQSSVRQLVDSQLNNDPRRGNSDIHPLETIQLRSVVLANLDRQGLGPDAVPESGRRVLVAANGNHAIDCTDDLHPEVAHICTLAARVIGLDIAGIDLVCRDISQPLAAQGGAIVEVNAGPSLLMHLNPAQGQPRAVGEAILSHLFQDDTHGRIPIVGVSGSQHSSHIATLIAWLLQLSGHQVGLACRDGMFVGRRKLENHDASAWETGRRLLINRNVEAAVFESDPLSLLTEGLPYDRCHVGIVTDSLPVPGLDENLMPQAEHRFKILRTQVDVVLPSGAAVLNADDPTVLDMADLCDGDVLLYAIDGQHPALIAHRALGKRTIFMKGDIVVQEDQHRAFELVDRNELPPAVRAMSPDVVLAAVGAALALSLNADTITTGLKTFEPLTSGQPLSA